MFEEIEMPLLAVISRIERNGVLIDQNILAKHSQELTTRLKELEEKAHELAGEPFNLSSTKQLQTILFEKQDQAHEKRRAARLLPAKKCWPSWRSTIRCRK